MHGMRLYAAVSYLGQNPLSFSSRARFQRFTTCDFLFALIDSTNGFTIQLLTDMTLSFSGRTAFDGAILSCNLLLLLGDSGDCLSIQIGCHSKA